MPWPLSPAPLGRHACNVRSSVWIRALKQISALLTDLTPRFAAERAEPRVPHLLNRPDGFVR